MDRDAPFQRGRVVEEGFRISLLANSHRWALDWNALAAIAAMLAAGATSVLAYFTWRLARSTTRLAAETASLARETASEIEAGWQPLIIPMLEEPAKVEAGSFTHRVRNEGRGPARNVRFVLRSADAPRRPITESERIHRAPAVSSTWYWTARVPVDGRELDQLQLAIEYEDIAGNRFGMEIIYAADPDPASRGPGGAASFNVVTFDYLRP